MSENQDVKRFLLRKIPSHPDDISSVAASHFGISRQAINRHLRKLTAEGLIEARGKTRARRYELVVSTKEKVVPLDPTPEEDSLWRQWALPELADLPKNVRDIAHYGFTEMVNNAIDHSEGGQIVLRLERSAASIDLGVIDDGVGIFQKIQRAFSLDDEKHAVLELSKGKLTTDPARHTGEGIFFTSRMFDTFWILSGSLFLGHMPDDSDWLVEHTGPRAGTLIQMLIDPMSKRTVKEVFDRFTDTGNGYGFDVTHVPVALAQYGEENLVSRSQAKRLVARFERFRKVVLNFEGVESIGQAFADQVFRVFRAEHPDVQLTYANANEDVKKMISRAMSNAVNEQMSLM